MPILELTFASGEDSLSVRRFRVEEAMSRPFKITVTALSPNPQIDLESIVGQPALLRVISGFANTSVDTRQWTGVCKTMRQMRVEPDGLSTYKLTIVPSLWLLSQRRNHRVFQGQSIPDIVDQILAEWRIERIWNVFRGQYPPADLRLQYGESDLAFISRLLEEVGIAYYFVDDIEKGSVLILHEQPHANDPREAPPIPFFDSREEAQARETEYVTALTLGHRVRPGKHTIRDFDFRRPGYPLMSRAALGASSARPGEVKAIAAAEGMGEAAAQFGGLARQIGASAAQSALATISAGADLLAGRNGKGVAAPSMPVDAVTGERQYDQYHFRPDSFRVAGGHDEGWGAVLAERGLEADRFEKRHLTFETNVLDLAPGVVFSVTRHPRDDLGPAIELLSTAFTLEGTPAGEWHTTVRAAFAADPYRPPRLTPKPRVEGFQSAIVIGAGEIDVDPYGRVLVAFHWDREGKASCRVRVSHGWAGFGYGTIMHPRVGHEVMIDFLDGDPDAPVVVGRLYNGTAQVPYPLPENKTVSTWKTESSPGGGGFNEIKLEDRTGDELFYMQAEKDLVKLVKNDETTMIGHDRTKIIDNDESISIGHDRTKVVGNDESVTVKNNHFATIGNDELVSVGHDRSTQVGKDDQVVIGKDRVQQIGKSDGLSIGGNLSEFVGKKLSRFVKKHEQETIGKHKQVSVGLNQTTTVGLVDSTFVGTYWSASVAPGIVGLIGGAVGSVLGGSVLGSLLKGGAAALGDELAKALGGPLGADPAAAAMGAFKAVLPPRVSTVVSLFDSPIRGLLMKMLPLLYPPTSISLTPKAISLTTGKASIHMTNESIYFDAKGGIFLDAKKSIGFSVDTQQEGEEPEDVTPPPAVEGQVGLHAMNNVAAYALEGAGMLAQQGKVFVRSAGAGVIVQSGGGKMVKLNPGEHIDAPPPAE